MNGSSIDPRRSLSSELDYLGRNLNYVGLNYLDRNNVRLYDLLSSRWKSTGHMDPSSSPSFLTSTVSVSVDSVDVSPVREPGKNENSGSLYPRSPGLVNVLT